MLESLINSFSLYYGLDWLALASGLSGTLLITNKDYRGFGLSIISCLSGFAVALLSGQYGFVVYNLMLLALMARGFFTWSSANQQPLVPQKAHH